MLFESDLTLGLERWLTLLDVIRDADGVLVFWRFLWPSLASYFPDQLFCCFTISTGIDRNWFFYFCNFWFTIVCKCVFVWVFFSFSISLWIRIFLNHLKSKTGRHVIKSTSLCTINRWILLKIGDLWLRTYYLLTCINNLIILNFRIARIREFRT